MKGKVALVTGSTSGIGLGLARALAREGVHLMLHGLGDPGAMERLRQDLASESGVTVRYNDADVSRAAEVARLVTETEQAFGSLDILVNNAGIQFVSPVEEFPPERWTAIQDIVLNASFYAIRAAVPGMKRRGRGRIINLVSAHGLVASPFKSAYVAAKHGQIGLTKTVALELAETAITCNAICPVYVRTPLVEGQIESQAKLHQITREQVIRDVILATQPTRRFIAVEEVAIGMWENGSGVMRPISRLFFRGACRGWVRRRLRRPCRISSRPLSASRRSVMRIVGRLTRSISQSRRSLGRYSRQVPSLIAFRMESADWAARELRLGISKGSWGLFINNYQELMLVWVAAVCLFRGR